MNGIGDAIASAFFATLIAVAVISATLAGLAVWGLPKLWVWLKPWIHMVTA